MDYEPDQEDSNMAELEVEIELPTPKQNPPKSAVTRLVQKRGADHVTAPLTAAGTRSSAPDSSSEELVTAEPDKERRQGQQEPMGARPHAATQRSSYQPPSPGRRMACGRSKPRIPSPFPRPSLVPKEVLKGGIYCPSYT